MKTRLWFAGIFISSLIVYLFTLSPHLSFTDAGELAGACYSLGVAHPTGYPLFVLLGNLWLQFPLPFSVIYRLNLFAAFCTALSASMMFLLMREVLHSYWVSTHLKTQPTNATAAARNERQSRKKRRVDESGIDEKAVVLDIPFDSSLWSTIVCASIALSYAFARTVWSQALSIEVYSLHLTLLTSVLYFSVRAVTHERKRDLLWAAMSLGLCFTNHLTTILVVLPVIALFFYRPNRGLKIHNQRLRQFALLLLVVVTCSLVYVYLPLTSLRDPWFNWGAVHRGWEQFSYHVYGKQYSVWMFSDEIGVAAKQFKVFLNLVPHNTFYVGTLFSIWGAVALFRNRSLRPLLLFFVLMIVGGVGYSIHYNIHDIDTYFLSSFIALLCLSGIGVYDLIRRRPRYSLLCILLPLASLVSQWKHCDQHDNTLVYDYVHLMIDPLPKNAVLISQQWDYFCSAFWYMQQVEGYRPDVVLIEKELLRRTWYAHQLQRWYPWAITSSQAEIDRYMVDLSSFEKDAEAFKQDPAKSQEIQTKFIAMLNSFVRKNIEARPVFATQEVFQGEEGFAKDEEKTPFGLAYHLTRGASTLSVDTAALNCDHFVSSSKAHHSEHLEKNIAEIASHSYLNSVGYYANMQRYAKAEWFCTQALRIDPKNTSAHEALSQLKSITH